ncbi:MAG: tetratricopeptide repeat protein [Burkholderiales bacterium]|nr:tetratricopeptide repeat protein [Burkholderiales bacterium]
MLGIPRSSLGEHPASELLAAGLDAYRNQDLQGACHLLERASALEPGNSAAHKALADALCDLGRWEAADVRYRSAVELDPRFARAWNNWGLLRLDLNDVSQAIAAFESAVATDPDLVPAQLNLATALERAGRMQAALDRLNATVATHPESALARNNLGAFLYAMGRREEAARHYRAGLDQDPLSARLWHNLGLALRDQGRIEQAMHALDQALAITPDDAVLTSDRLLLLNYRDGNEAQVSAAHKAWGLSQPRREPLPWDRPETFRPVLDGRRRLRVGYVSADFGLHVVSFFLQPILAVHARAGGPIELFCYFNGAAEDEQSDLIRNLPGVHWRAIHALDDATALARMRSDRLDVAIDLSGHTTGHRLPLFAKGIAPIQATWLGYPNTTGLEAIDWRITDTWADPPNESNDRLYAERLFRMDRTGAFLAYGPRPEAPPVSPLPALGNGFVTFGSFNNLSKCSDPALALWARVLDAVPRARLLVKARSLDEPETCAWFRRRFRAAGGDIARLDLESHQPGYVGHLARYAAVDIALDSQPYCGTTTTCEALWMGVPVITLSGTTHRSRVGTTLLNAAGLPEWIASDTEEFVSIAAEAAANLEDLRALRAGLRHRLSTGPLIDVARSALDMEAALRMMVVRHCEAGNR